MSERGRVTDEAQGLGYSFTPVPERALKAHALGLIDAMDYVLIAFVYERANTTRLVRRGETPALTLEQIRDGVSWTKTDNALYARIRRLRNEAEQWFSYRIERSGRRAVYVFKLLPEAPSTRSECNPSEKRSPSPSDGLAERHAGSGLPPHASDDSSESGNGSEPPARPSEVATRPSEKRPASGGVEPFSADRAAPSSPSPSDVQRPQEHLVTERLDGTSLDHRHIEGPNERETDTDALIAAVTFAFRDDVSPIPPASGEGESPRDGEVER